MGYNTPIGFVNVIAYCSLYAIFFEIQMFLKKDQKMKIRNDEKQMEQSKYNKGHFSKEEDTLILKYVNEHGKNNWKKVSAFVRTRSPKQCRERYYGSLEKSVNKDPFTDSQKMFISEFIYKHGNKWAELSRKLDTGHTPNMIKNKWHQQISR